jgi:hypothetical protein
MTGSIIPHRHPQEGEREANNLDFYWFNSLSFCFFSVFVLYFFSFFQPMAAAVALLKRQCTRLPDRGSHRCAEMVCHVQGTGGMLRNRGKFN